MLSTTYVKKYTCDRCGKTARYRFSTRLEKPSNWVEVRGRINGNPHFVQHHLCLECYDELFGVDGFVWEDGALDKITVLQDTVYTLTQLLEAEDDVEGVAIDDDYTIHVQYRGNDDDEEEVEWFGVEDAFDDDEEDETPTVADVLEELDMLAYLKEQAEEEDAPVYGTVEVQYYSADELNDMLKEELPKVIKWTCTPGDDEDFIGLTD